MWSSGNQLVGTSQVKNGHCGPKNGPHCMPNTLLACSSLVWGHASSQMHAGMPAHWHFLKMWGYNSRECISQNGPPGLKKIKQGAGSSKLVHLKVMGMVVVAKSKLEIHDFEFLKILVAKRNVGYKSVTAAHMHFFPTKTPPLAPHCPHQWPCKRAGAHLGCMGPPRF